MNLSERKLRRLGRRHYDDPAHGIVDAAQRSRIGYKMSVNSCLTDRIDMAKQICGNCRFLGRDQDWNICRQRPPVVIAMSGDLVMNRRIATRWPAVASDDWCGKWRARDPDRRNATE